MNEAWLQYLSGSDRDKVIKAYAYAKRLHEGVIRKDGSPYILHPLAVAQQLASYSMDSDTLCGALLHDIVEDTTVTISEIQSTFGEKIAELVEGLTKIESISIPDKIQARQESLIKMLLAATLDHRVMLIKLCDRLHNMQTLTALDEQRRKRISKETLDIYVPLAQRMGMRDIQNQLSELAFENLFPWRSSKLRQILFRTNEQSSKRIKSHIENVKSALNGSGIDAFVEERIKRPYRLYSSMENGDDIRGVLQGGSLRISVVTRESCYGALGVVHSLYRPLPGRFKDYIATPKDNGYRALHSKLLTAQGEIIEIQIQTHEMYEIAQYGVLMQHRVVDHHLTDRLKSLLIEIRNIITESETRSEAFNNIQTELLVKKIYLFTPNNDVITLSNDATVLDFAYAIHTDLGNHAVNGTVDGKTVTLDQTLVNGQSLEINQSDKIMVTPEWLDIVRTARARYAIRRILKIQNQMLGNINL
ncbi:MAG: HD domain-containing protein [Candidatus Thiodiazotropha endolucinida]|nr:HD domain-containing protein [Candidatus Thiodiazotropha taylori]MCW4311968.1 HD domain-containing protein [Candidatus Thiodiazotropha taylori]